MRISKIFKQQFIENIIGDIPTIDYIEQARNYVREDAFSKLPEEIKKILSNSALSQYIIPKHLAYHLPSLEGSNVYFSMQVSNPIYMLDMDTKKALDIILEKQVSQRKTTKDIRERIEAQMRNINTDTELKESFPEFLKYLPSNGITEGTKNLPVGESLYKQLSLLGFPKSEKSNVK